MTPSTAGFPALWTGNHLRLWPREPVLVGEIHNLGNAIAGSCSILLGRPAPQGSERAFLNVPRSGHCQLLLILLLDLHKVMRVELNSTGSAVADRCRSDGGPPGTSVSRVTGAAFCHACPDEAGTTLDSA